jgi:NitT/TauT family transport system substrate-binding protein
MKNIKTAAAALSLFVFVISGIAAMPVQEQDLLTVKAGSFKGPLGVTMAGLIDDSSSVTGPQGYQVSYTFYNSPSELVPKIVSGEVDIAALPSNLAAKLYNSGVDYRYAAVNVWGVLYLLSTNTEIRGWDDLAGKTVYSIGKGTTPDLLFRYLLEEHGIDPESEITIDYTHDQIGLSQLMTAGKVETAVLPEPFVSKVLSGNEKSTIVLDFQKEWGDVRDTRPQYPQSGVVVRGEFADNNPKALADFLMRYEESIKWVNDEVKDAALVVEKMNIGLKAEEAEAAIPRSNLSFAEADAVQKEVEDFLSFLLKFAPKSVGGKIPDDGFYLATP